jgi:alpha-ribazole phosphatase
MARRVTITLIRHLPTIGNKMRQYIGWTDESIVLIEDASLRLPWNPEIVFGSDLLRCTQSAAVYFPEAKYLSDERWRESNFGDWEQKTYEQLKDNPAYRAWIVNPHDNAPPSGERLIEMEKRVLSAFSEVPKEVSNHFIVTHGGPIRILLTRFSPEDCDFWSWNIPHGAAWRLEWDSEDDFKEGKRCTFLSEVPITANGTT